MKKGRFRFLVACIGILIFCLVQIRFDPSPLLQGSMRSEPFVMMEMISSQNAAINSATGTSFLGQPIRKYLDERLFVQGSGNRLKSKKKTIPTTSKNSSFHCEKWNVVTTIFAPSEAVKRAARVEGWCTVIVADTNTPADYMYEAGWTQNNNTESATTSSIRYLSVHEQERWHLSSQYSDVGAFLNVIPYKHFARKNIGYLYAIQHGAKFIFDFDDDNLLPLLNDDGRNVLSPLANHTHVQGVQRVSLIGSSAFNHHTLMGATIKDSWARGFPLQYIQNKATQGKFITDVEETEVGVIDLDMDRIGVLQFCANGNPDIDAIHRLVHPLPMHFQTSNDFQNKASSDSYTRISTRGSVIVPSHAFSPYNAQATIHTKKALWALFLPFTVPGRVSDIWRGYFAEVIFHSLELNLLYLPPFIIQERNHHHLLADMQAELDLYFKAGTLVDFLSGWHGITKTVPGRMEELWIELYERGYIELSDVKAVQLWLKALLEIGYTFPTLNTG